MSKSSKALVVVPNSKFKAMVARSKTNGDKKGRGGGGKKGGVVPWGTMPISQFNLLDCWRRSLVNPFEEGGCKLGFGCLVPTSLVRAYLRTTVTANADGSCTVALFGDTNYFLLLYNNATATINYTSATPASDESPIASNYQAGRIVSGGLKAFPSIAMTAAPGVCYAGQVFDQTLTNLQSVSTNDFISQSTNHMELGARGATATARPQDMSSFLFSVNVVNGVGFSSSITAPWSIPYISFSGLPASASIVVEAVLNIECEEIFKHSVTQIGVPETSSEPTLSDVAANIESAYRKISSSLPPAGTSLSATIGQAGSAISAHAVRALANHLVAKSNPSSKYATEL